MNEILTVYLHFDQDHENMEPVIRRVDEVIAPAGGRYSGIRNIYIPVASKQRDETICRVIHRLRNTDWLKPYKPVCMRGNRTHVTELLKVDVSHMMAPSPKKMKRYEEFYRKHHKLAQDILVDEKGNLRDGYTSYLLAMKYGADAAIMEVWSFKPIRKVVSGKLVDWNGREYTVQSDKVYRWVYNLKKAVIPGDILSVRTRKGYAYMLVSGIEYITGQTECSKYREVLNNETANL